MGSNSSDFQLRPIPDRLQSIPAPGRCPFAQNRFALGLASHRVHSHSAQLSATGAALEHWLYFPRPQKMKKSPLSQTQPGFRPPPLSPIYPAKPIGDLYPILAPFRLSGQFTISSDPSLHFFWKCSSFSWPDSFGSLSFKNLLCLRNAAVCAILRHILWNSKATTRQPSARNSRGSTSPKISCESAHLANPTHRKSRLKIYGTWGQSPLL